MRKWLPYFEAVMLVLLIALIFLNTKRGNVEATSPPPSQGQTFVAQGDEDFAKQDLAKALIAYWRAVQAFEADAAATPAPNRQALLHAHLRVSEIYFHSNWLQDAKAHLERAAKIDPDHPDVHLLRGKLLRDEGEQVAAVNEFLKVVEADATHAEVHYLLGVLYQGAKQYEQAMTHYEKAIESDPDLTAAPFESAPIGLQARLQLSRTYRRLLQDYRFIDRELTDEEQARLAGLEDKGIAILEEAVEKDPNFLVAKEELIGLLYAQAGALGRGREERFYDESLTVYEKITQLDPTEVDAWMWMGQIHNTYLQDPEAALDAYKKAYALEPDLGTLAEIKSLEESLQQMTNY
ncbi:MAG: tetratricopeptide repeat protein [Candidatus Poribacteria bacterium]|nr:tetratricopeptide repeat protein [Candidatus Poribacteria bacterium]